VPNLWSGLLVLASADVVNGSRVVRGFVKKSVTSIFAELPDGAQIAGQIVGDASFALVIPNTASRYALVLQPSGARCESTTDPLLQIAC
jgi:hypothetical protein